MAVAIKSFGLTDKGKVRETNQDNFLIVDIRKSILIRHSSLPYAALSNSFGSVDAHLYVVADGVGGGPRGDKASEATVSALLAYVSETVDCFNAQDSSTEQTLFDRLEETVRGVHQSLRDEHPHMVQGPATTLTMVLLIWPRAYLVHVGDSRAYVRRGGQLQQITRDQTVGEDMIAAGVWTEEQAARSKPGALLTSAIGGPQLAPSVGLVDLDPGDSIMLCSDGLTKHVSVDRIAKLMEQANDVEGVSRRLIEEALAGGGTDNISVIVVTAFQ
ncbi:MAG: PP2C family serine/threonine-protein phosphatase [Gemmatimonadaceae bacterium]